MLFRSLFHLLLQLIYSKAQPQKVEEDILGYLALLQKERALDFEL